MAPKPRDITERFWEKVDRTGPCWLWLAAKTGGYGSFTLRRGKQVRAHRFAYELLVGPIPEGLQLDHVRARGCTNRHCVNPAHLEPVTHRENILRGDTVPAARARKTHCDKGHLFDEVNTHWRARGGRECRACVRERKRARRTDPALRRKDTDAVRAYRARQEAVAHAT